MKTFVPILLTVLAMTTPSLAQQTMDHSAHGEMAQMDHSNHGDMDPSGAQPDDTPATTAYRAAMVDMHMNMDVEYTNDADVDFMRGMIPIIRAPSIWPASSWSTARTRRCAPWPRRSSRRKRQKSR